jgi:hypothetical protein
MLRRSSKSPMPLMANLPQWGLIAPGDNLQSRGRHCALTKGTTASGTHPVPWL